MATLKRACLAALVLTLLLAGVVGAQDSACDLDSEDAYLERGYSHWEAEDYEAAILDYTCALAMNPNNLPALFGRGYSYYELEDYDHSLADYNHYLELDPLEGPAWNNLGNLYYVMGDYDDAKLNYLKALDLRGDEKYITYNNLASVFYETGDYATALTYYNDALELNPNYADARLNRAHIQLLLGNESVHEDFSAWLTLIRQRTETRTAAELADGAELRVTEGLEYLITFTATAGQTVRAAARTTSGSELDPLLVLVDSAGNAVASDDDSGVNLDAVLSYEVPVSQQYTLRFGHAGGGSEGTATVTLTLDGDAANDVTFAVFSLAVHDTAVIFTTASDRLNLRSGPGLGFDILDKLERDTTVTILEGPRKADGYAWWRVRTAEGSEGWAVERVETEQTLQPALAVGGEARVTTTAGDSLRLRDAAGTGGNVIGMIENGTILTLLDGPQPADGMPWWKVRTPDGAEGWVAERVGDERTLSRGTGEG
ncbi:MAG: SH3 domain-containing protein [Chloroflexi bacterium]|nr:SH3 domain-containing protein [Chloroflexota bacterium]